MADTLTANYNITKPEPGGSTDTWGAKLNAGLDKIDAQMKVNADTAANAPNAAKLGGQLPGYYTNITARLGYTPLANNAQAVDSAKLGGQLPAYYTDIIARLGYTPLNVAGGVMTGSLVMSSGSRVRGNADNAQFLMENSTGERLLEIYGNGGGDVLFIPYSATGISGSKRLTLRYGGDPLWDVYTMWHAGNDGSGSGLDADTVDGIHASSFAQLYTGSNANETSFPLGHPIIVPLGSPVSRNASTPIYLGNNDSGYYTVASNEGAGLAGTWRSRGYGVGYSTVFQRTA